MAALQMSFSAQADHPRAKQNSLRRHDAYLFATPLLSWSAQADHPRTQIKNRHGQALCVMKVQLDNSI
jgi:hypothetical protein